MGSPATREPIQFIVSEDGERTGVVLSWETYSALRREQDADRMDDLSDGELQALADGMLATTHQARLEVLLHRNRAGQLGDDERQELDRLLSGIDALNILKARALYTLRHRTATTS